MVGRAPRSAIAPFEVIREIPAPFWRECGDPSHDGILLRFPTGEEVLFSRYELSERPCGT